MGKGEIVPRATAETTTLVSKDNTLYGTYDGITVHQDLTGGIGVGVAVDEKALRHASYPVEDPHYTKYLRRFANYGVVGGSAVLEGMVIFGSRELGSATSIVISGIVAVIGGIGYATGAVLPHLEKKRRAAVASLEQSMTYIPSVDLKMDISGIPDEITTTHGLTNREDLVAILQGMQTSHLTQEAASEFTSSHKTTVNPALVVKGGLLSLSEENRGRFMQNVFDDAPEMKQLATSLNRYSALSVTEAGREGLRDQSTLLLGKLGNIAGRFIDLKSDEALPKVKSLIELADDANIKAGLEEAQALLSAPTVKLDRYNFAIQNWDTTGLN